MTGVVVTLLLIVAALGGCYAVWASRSHKAAPDGPITGPSAAPGHGAPGPRLIPVLTGVAKRGDLPVYLTGLGTVTPLANVVIRSRVDGQLMRIGFTEGQMVKSGDVIAEIDARPFAAALKQMEGQLVKDQALLDNARVDLKRYQDGGAIFSEQQIVTQQALVNQSIGVVESDQGQVDSARLQVEYCRITAPMDGRVGLRLVDQGNMVHASDATGLVVLTVLQPITAIFTIGQDDIPTVLAHTATTPNLTVDAFSRDLSKRLATGSLSAIDNQVDPGSGTVRLRARFENADRQLFPNQFVNVRMLIDIRKNVLLVPTAAVQLAPDGSFVWVVGKDAAVSVHHITASASEGGLTMVDGIQVGDVVVTDGVDKLQPGTKVQPRSPGDAPQRAGAAGPSASPAPTQPDAGAPGAAPPAKAPKESSQ
jgi:multidrug efflux system membrane fusion protein